MQIVIVQRISVEPYRVLVLTRLVDSMTGEILDEWSQTYFNQSIDDCIHAAQCVARDKARELGGVRIRYDVKVN
jgi:TolB-like protein